MFAVGRIGSVSRERGIGTEDAETYALESSDRDDAFVIHYHGGTLKRVRHEKTKVVGKSGTLGQRGAIAGSARSVADRASLLR